ncbi:MAG: hypothetical protein N2643_02415 [Endomicrobia bacterium]|nr:hypothetical protein [Endomicrobiia bacterium]
MKIFLPNKFFLVILVFIPICIFSNDNIKLKAQKVIYDKETNIVVAEQNVEIIYRDIKLKTENLVFDLNKNVIFIDTSTYLTYYGDEMLLKRLTYDIKEKLITINDFYAHYGQYYSFSKECVLDKNIYKLSEAKITHCNLKRPHYYFASKKVNIYPNDKILLYNPTLIVGSLPVLWLPYYRVSLKPTKDQLLIEPGFESDKGIIAKIRYTRKLTDTQEARIIFDNYSNKSIGLGAEYRYTSKLHNGVIYTYYVDEYKAKNNHWNIVFNNTHQLPFNFSFRNNIEFISDKQVNYYYNKESWFFVKRDINSSISLGWQAQKLASRISYTRLDTFSEEKQEFVNSQVKYPFEFIIYPFNLGKLKFSENLTITPTLIEGTTYYRLEAQNNFSTNLPLRFYFLTLTPSLIFTTIYTHTSLSGWHNLYGFSLPARFTMGKLGVFDMTYNCKIRSQNNSFNLVTSTKPYTNEIRTSLNMYHKLNYLRVSTSYNFLKQPSTYWYERFSNITADAGVSIKLFDISIYTETDIVSKSLKNLQVSCGINILTNRFSLSYSKSFSQPQRESVITQVDLYNKDNYQIKFKTANAISKQKYEFLNGRLELYKDLHCWEASFYCDTRKSLSTTQAEYIYEFGGNVGLKFKPYVGKGQKISEIDARYFPWKD